MIFFQRHRTAIILSILIVFCLMVISFSVKSPEGIGIFRKFVQECAGPAESVLNRPIQAVERAWNRYLFLFCLEEENIRLRQQNALLTRQLVQYQEGYLEAFRLQKILKLQEQGEYKGVTARVTGRTRGTVSRTLVIDRGSVHGVKPGQPVIVEQGAVGRVVEASWHTARVLLIIDESSNVDALLQPSRVQGILMGTGSRGCQLKYVGKMDPVHVGDAVISSGIADIFPKGLLLGVVCRVEKTAGLFQKIEVAPAVDFSRLEEVLVLSGR